MNFKRHFYIFRLKDQLKLKRSFNSLLEILLKDRSVVTTVSRDKMNKCIDDSVA